MRVHKPILATLGTAGLVLACSLAAMFIGIIAAYPHDVLAKPTDGGGPVTVNADLAHGLVPKDGGTIYLHIGLEALRREQEGRRTPVNVALVIDRSGSMRGDRLAAAKQAAREALSRLSSDDTVAIVAYDHNVNVLRDAARVRDFEAIEAAIDRLEAGGRTALYAGVQEGARQLERYLSERRINRVILLSDGLANVGPSSPNDLAKLGQKLAGKGMSVTTIGLGLNYNEDLMQQLALASDGNHAFAESPEDLAGIFNAEFGDTLGITAQDIEIIIRCKPGYRPIRMLGRQGEIDGDRITVKLAQLTGGSERYLIVEIEAEPLGTGARAPIAEVGVDYMDLAAGARQSERLVVEAARSAAADEIEASAKTTILAKVTEQKANIATEEAVRLRDAGDIEAARKMLEQNAATISRFSQRNALSGASADRLVEMKKRSEEAARALAADDWAKTRKSMRYEQHKAKRQQTY